MTNELFRDLIERKIPMPSKRNEYVPPVITQTGDMEFRAEMTIYGHQYTRPEYMAMMQAAINNAFERMEMMREVMALIAVPPLIDYGAQRGLTGLEHAHFNDAINKLATTTPWKREECARALGRLMDALGSAPQRMHGNNIGPILYDETNQRVQALAAKQRQGKGPPSSSSWRGRERTTKFRSQS